MNETKTIYKTKRYVINKNIKNQYYIRKIDINLPSLKEIGVDEKKLEKQAINIYDAVKTNTGLICFKDLINAKKSIRKNRI
ncbi:MAG: hypothetical protein ACOCP8_01920 [archaeon]